MPRAGTRVLLAAAAAATALRLTDRLPEPWRRPWLRTNHAGDPVTLLEGPAWVLGALSGLALPGSRGRGRAAALAVAAAGLGLLDDLSGSRASTGLRGHLAALRRGEVTTGTVKLVGLVAAGVAVVTMADHADRGHAHAAPARRLVGTLVGGGVVAGAANLVNLLDLRPGRALKVTLAIAAPLAVTSPVAAGTAGATLGVITDDLAARAMLGDTGANAAGALLGLAGVERTGLLGRCIALAALTALTLASERVSFSAVIDRQPLLRRVDRWGRPPAHPTR
ncbi:hypothetical protein [Intrasporangium sp.]|uniref:hypothetical protein n=1 Tax=Intrasporangium sp. TaxID=1925024 RepID=UPI0032220AB3